MRRVEPTNQSLAMSRSKSYRFRGVHLDPGETLGLAHFGLLEDVAWAIATNPGISGGFNNTRTIRILELFHGLCLPAAAKQERQGPCL